jgi:hypothetical protein
VAGQDFVKQLLKDDVAVRELVDIIYVVPYNESTRW